jgi:hypothetical protein
MTNLDVLHADYEDWCMGKCFTAHSAEAFAEEYDGVRWLPELAGNIEKQGNRYFGIALVDANVAWLRMLPGGRK